MYDFWSCEELGAVVVQCGRRAIMLKGWVMLRVGFKIALSVMLSIVLPRQTGEQRRG